MGSIIKNIYGRLFRYIVDMCNCTLIVSDPKLFNLTIICICICICNCTLIVSHP